MDKKTLLILSGPNLNLLGQREPDVYGDSTLDEHLEVVRLAAEKHSFVVKHFQSNHEGELVDSIQDARESCDVQSVHETTTCLELGLQQGFQLGQLSQ